MKHFDRAGRPMSYRSWVSAFEEEERHLGDDYIRTRGGQYVRVSTVWMGIDHSFGYGPPLIFETMVFPECDGRRYATEREAFIGHQETLGEYAQDWWLDLGGRA